MNLRLDWCSHQAAKFAVEKWHYSRALQVGKAAHVGVWEDDKFIGVVVFTGLTAWDVQRIKSEYFYYAGHEVAQKMQVMGALSLYLNFVNLFQMLLSLTGERE